MQFAVVAVHFAFEGRIDRALLLNSVLAAKAFIDHLGREMRAIVTLHGDLSVWKTFADQVLDGLSVDRLASFIGSIHNL